MAKRGGPVKPVIGDTIVCPYCRRKGQVMRVFDDGDHGYHVDVSHLSERRMVRSQATGIEIEMEVFVDGCSKDGKIGLVARRPETQSFEDMNVTEEPL